MIQIGDSAFRRKDSHYGTHWIKIQIVGHGYMELINEFPEDYRPANRGDKSYFEAK